MAHRVDLPRPLPAAQSFKARIELPVLQEWLVGMPWEEFPFLDRLPGTTRSPHAEVVGKTSRDAPDDLVGRRYTYMLEECSPAHVAQWSGGR